MTIALYARRKQWPLTGVTVRLRHSRVHAEDCAECETRQGMLDRIESEIALDGDLTEEQRLKALEIANKCRSIGRSRRRSIFGRGSCRSGRRHVNASGAPHSPGRPPGA